MAYRSQGQIVAFDRNTGERLFAIPSGGTKTEERERIAMAAVSVVNLWGNDLSRILIARELLSSDLNCVLLRAKRLSSAVSFGAPRARLSKREKEVLNGILAGQLNKQIASELNISERTVKFYVSSLFKKLKVDSRFQILSMFKERLITESPTLSA